MSSTPRLIGTLIVVVLKAKNLPNKRHIGKQDPYCTIKLNNETKRTKAVKRGGQHPEWDEEVRFELFEDMEDEIARTSRKRHGDEHDGHSPPPPPPKEQLKERKVKGGKSMRLLCYADDPREPELIGETNVDLSEALTKGETDEWFTLMHKDKYCGEIYLELTFWSNDKPPEKKQTSRPSNLHPQYGGPGSFTPSSSDGGRGSSGSSPTGGNKLNLHERQGSTPIDGSHSSIPPTSSLAKLNLYIPPYDRDPIAHPKKYDPSAEFGDSRRRDSYPPINNHPVPAYTSPQNFNQNPLNPNPFENVTIADPYATPTHSTYYQHQQSQFTGSMYQSNPPPVASGFVPPQPTMTPHPSGFQPLYSSFTAPRPSATPMPAYIPPPSSMGYHNYPPNPAGFIAPTPQPQIPQQVAAPPFQHHPNSYPSVNQPQNPGLNVNFNPPQQPISAPPTPFGQQIAYQPSQIQPGQRPLPEQPQSNPAAIAFPNPAPFVPNQQQGVPAFPGNQNAPPKPVNQAPPAPTGFIPPPPPPPITAQQRSNSMPPAPSNLPSSGSGQSVASNGPLPVPPQSVSQQNTGNTASSNNSRSGLPLPPLPNPPSQVQSGLNRSTSALPGPPPPLNGSHQQQGSYSSVASGFNAQPPYNSHNLPQPPVQYGAQPAGTWQPQSQIYAPGLAPAQPFGQGPPPAAPVPYMAAYPPQMQTQWRG